MSFESSRLRERSLHSAENNPGKAIVHISDLQILLPLWGSDL